MCRYLPTADDAPQVDIMYSNISLAAAVPAHEAESGLLHLQLLRPIRVGSNEAYEVQFELKVSGKVHSLNFQADS